MHTHIRRNTIQYFLHFPQCMKYGHTDFPWMESLLVSNKLFIPRQTSYPQQRSFLVASWIVQSSNPTENHKIQTRGYLVLHALLFKLIFVLYSVHSSLLLLYRPIQFQSSPVILSHFSLLSHLRIQNALVPLEDFIGYVQTISTSFLQLTLPLPYHIYHRSKLITFLYGHKPNATHTFPQHLSIKHVFFQANILHHTTQQV